MTPATVNQGRHAGTVCLLVQRLRLGRLVKRTVGRCGAGLRRECVHAKRPEGPALIGQRSPMPARAVPAQVKLASPVDPVRRADRGSASITCLIHFLPPAEPRPPPLSIDWSLLQICSLDSAGVRPSGPPPNPELVRAALVIVVPPGRCRAPVAYSAGSGRARHAGAISQVAPSTHTERPSPRSDTFRTLPNGPLSKTSPAVT